MWLKAFTTFRALLCIPWENYAATHVVCRGGFFDYFVRRVLTFYLYQCRYLYSSDSKTLWHYQNPGRAKSGVWGAENSSHSCTCTPVAGTTGTTTQNWVQFYVKWASMNIISCSSIIWRILHKLATGYWLLVCALVLCTVSFCSRMSGKVLKKGGTHLCLILYYGTTNYMQAKRERIQVSTKLRHLADFFCCLLSVGVVIDPMAYS